jgi:hypothetical protein
VRERLRIGETDVLAREAHHATREIERILARREHPAEPVERRVGVALAQRLVERRDEVEVLLARLVVEHDLALHDVLHRGCRISCAPPAAASSATSSRMPSARRASPFARRVIAFRRLSVNRSPLAPSPRSDVGQRVAQQAFKVALRQPLEHDDATAGEQRGVELERRVFGRRADEHDVAALDVGQEGVLLGAIEAVDLVDEEQRALALRDAQARRPRPSLP